MNTYEINEDTLALVPISEENVKVYEKDTTLDCNGSCAEIMDNSCRYYGSTYEGRREGSKHILGVSYKLPIIIEESKFLIFFPTESPLLDSCIWLSLNNIEKIEKKSLRTIIHFINKKKIIVNSSYRVIENQMMRATRLESLLRKRQK